MLIYEKSGVITPEQDKTNIFLPFDVPEGTEKLILDYTYSPKILENKERAMELIKTKLKQYGGKEAAEDYLPVKNLITLSLDDNGEYRGAAHRQAECQHHEISADYASPGFLKGKIHCGVWQLVLNVHCCACDVHYSIKISGEEKL